MFDLISKGGPIMYALLGLSVFSLTVVIERLIFWAFRIRKIKHINWNNLVEILTQVDLNESTGPGVGALTPMYNAVREGGRLKLAKFLKLESEKVYQNATRHLSGLDTVVAIAPLLGILGTVLGIMKSFSALDFQMMRSAGEVGTGLAEAMITTAAGLVIAVPSLLFANVFYSIADRYASRLYNFGQDIEYSYSDSES
ncbi:MAG: MotA/TolQ/ExbB proton channel family protein [Bdellovibrionales bacterium]|nr:MotA/TolQ/ExbB proton channel family protein [Bdellovibrionales bacterium]